MGCRRSRGRAGAKRTIVRRGGAWLLVLGLATAGAPAPAYQIASPIHDDCHERLTFAALQAAAAAPGLPAATTHDDEVLAAALQFDVTRYGTSLPILSLIMGARHNDLHGRSVLDIAGISPVHADPHNQREHCLRNEEDDGPAGIAAALDRCRGFIREMVALAAPDDALDATAQVSVPEYLLFRGTVDIPVSRLYFYLGRALHGVQDSFSHTLRSDDGRQVEEVFNWLEQLRDVDEPDRDGYPHDSDRDACRCPESRPWQVELFSQAQVASAALLDTVLTAPSFLSRQEQLDAFFAIWMSERPGCSAANGYCDNRLLAEMTSSAPACAAPLRCDVGTLTRDPGVAPRAVLAVGLALLVAAGRGRARRRAARLLVVLLAAASGPLAAQPAPPASRPASAATQPATAPAGCVEAPGEEAPSPAPRPRRPPEGLYVIFRNAVSSDNPALSFELATLYRGRRFGAGLAFDYNPFLAFERGSRVSAGALNVVADGSLHVQITDRFSLRFEGRVGYSALLFETPGYRTGDSGLFLGFRAAGFDYRMVRDLYLMIDPVDIALPIFKPHHLPLFFYRQWRVAGGVAWRFGARGPAPR